MRIYLQLSPNKERIPFNYQRSLVGAFHRWLGENELHDDISLYSLSWLSHGKASKQGLNFPNGCQFFISSPLPDLHQKAIQGIFNGQHIRWGMEVQEIRMFPTPKFGSKKRFIAQSPILIKHKTDGDKHAQFYYPHDNLSNELLTQILKHKLERMNLPTDVSMRFDSTYSNPQIKKIRYQGIDIKGTLCPVIVEGDPRAVQFAWEVGAGHSTGIGFGALK